MKQTKKQNQKPFWIIWWIVIIAFASFIILNIIYSNKTQAELDIDDCNSNPRDDNDCKCEEKSKIFRGWVSKDSQKAWEHWNYTCYPSDTPAIKNNETIEMINCFEEDCLKSRPKTECEKGNPDWVEGYKLFDNHGKYKHFVTKREVTEEEVKKYIKDNQDIILLDYQTICREKIDVEKYSSLISIDDMSCEKITKLLKKKYLVGRILGCDRYPLDADKAYCNALKQAWSQKGCQI